MRKISISAFSILVALLPIITLASYKASSVSAYTYQDPFHPNSIWNAPIPSNASVASNSAQMIQQIRNEYGGTNLPWTIAGVEQPWGVPVYYADSNTPRVRVCGNDGNYCTNNVPIASNFYPSPDSDAKIVIIETNANPQRAWSFWGFRAGSVNGSQYISDYGAYGWSDITDNGDGLTLNAGGQWGGRASGANYIGGLIDPEEIQSGVIDHALAISFTGSAVSQNTRWWPARGGDGYSTNANAVPYGARIQLDPSFDINTIPTTNGARAIARALQTYGAWVMDTGGSFALYAREYVNSNGSINRTPWNGLINASEIESYIPWTSLRVLTQQNANDFYPINSGNPVLTSVTSIPTYTNDTTPSFTFRSTQAGTISYGGSCSSVTTTAVVGNNTVTFNVLAQGTYSNCTIRVTNSTGGQSNIISINTFTIDTTAPIISSSATIPGGYNQTPTYTFNSDEIGYTVWGGACSTTDTNVINGMNNKTLNFIPRGTYSNCTLRVQDRATNISNQININAFNINGWGNWSPSGGSTVGKIVTENVGSRMYQSVRGDNGRIYTRWLTGSTWNSWLEDGGSTPLDVSLASDSSRNRLYQSAVGRNYRIYTRWFENNVWTAWMENGGSSFYPVVTNVVGDYLIQTVRGSDNRIYSRTFDASNGSWGSWVQNGATDSTITQELSGNRIYQTVRGDNNRIYTRYFENGTWSSWMENGGSAVGDVALAADSVGGILYQTVRGTNSRIYTRTYNGSTWTAWVENGGSTNRNINLKFANGRLHQTVVGDNTRIYTRFFEESNWSAWIESGSTPSEISTSYFNNVVYQFVRGDNFQIYVRDFI